MYKKSFVDSVVLFNSVVNRFDYNKLVNSFEKVLKANNVSFTEEELFYSCFSDFLLNFLNYLFERKFIELNARNIDFVNLLNDYFNFEIIKKSLYNE